MIQIFAALTRYYFVFVQSDVRAVQSGLSKHLFNFPVPAVV
jgi:hypothetical protein